MPARRKQQSNLQPKNPFISEVLEPAAGHYVVIVRMTTALAKDYPSKPWGTSIGDIGLAPKDAERFAGYELVDVEQVTGTEDLYWIFQKLDGPIWNSVESGTGSMIPQKFRRQVTTTKTEQEVDPATSPTAISGDLILSVVEDQKNTGKATKVNVSEVIDEEADALVGEKTDIWGVNSTSEALITEGDPTTYGFGVKASSVTPLGDGKAIEQIERYPPDSEPDSIIYKLEAQNTEDKSGIVLDIDKELVDATQAKTLAAARRAAGWFTELQPLDKWHTILLSTKPDATSLPGSPEVWNEVMNINLPNQLVEVGVIWDLNDDSSGGAAGTDDNAEIEANEISWNVSAEAMVSGTISGRPYTKIKAGISGAANVSVSRTYHVGPPTNTITPHVFQPVYGAIIIKGIQGSYTAKGNQSGVGVIRVDNSVNYRSHFDTNMVIHDFGPIEHSSPSMVYMGDSVVQNPPLNLSVTATTGTLPGTGFYPVVTAALEITGNATLELPASSAPLVSTNTYIANVSVKEWGFGIWVREVYTVTVP